jgi:hypothetical protein
MDALSPDLAAAQPEMPDVYILDPAFNFEARLTAVEGSLTNIEAALTVENGMREILL